MPARKKKAIRRKENFPSAKAGEPEKKIEAKSPSTDSPQTAEQQDTFPIVGVGASAGGIHALEGLLSTLPAKIRFAMVVVQHLDPKRESMIPKILSRKTTVPVRHIEHGEKIEAGCIYVKPPDRDLLISKRRFNLKEPDATVRLQLPIDLFFRSLAQEVGERAVGIILSGTGSDGSHGVKEIQGAGGLVIIQDEKQAEHSGMPRSAMDTSAVDMVLPVEKMAEQLIRYTAHRVIFRDEMEEEREQNSQQEDIRKILRALQLRTGHDFSQYKRSTTHRRLSRRMAVNRIESLSEYARYVQENNDEAGELFKDLLLNVTSFFRDPKVFEKMERDVIPQILKKKQVDSLLRVWVPGCSTGEEPYTIAILFLEAMEREGTYLNLKIFATDINPEIIERARQGLFRDNIAADVNPERLSRFFEKNGGGAGYKIKGSVRDLIVFSVHDITRDAPLTRMDLVSCRNVLIYMNADLQKNVLPIFHYSLNPDGFLLLGTSEGIGEYVDLFEPVEQKLKIFTKTGEESHKYWGKISTLSQRHGSRQDPKSPGEAEEKEDEGFISPEVLEYAFSEMGPSGVIVDEKRRAVYFIGDTKPFLSLPAGRPTSDVIRMANESIRLKLEDALVKAKSTGSPVRIKGLNLACSEPSCPRVDVKVAPIVRSRGHFLVTFDQSGSDRSDEDLPETTGPSRENMLERELMAARQQLQSIGEQFETTSEELKSANEELQANNEELQSTNEELESSKEELQSINEELETANQELQQRNHDLLRAEDDAKNLIGASDVATIFLNRDLRIKRFTPAATRMFNLIDKDVGRPLADITTNFSYERFHEDVRDAMENLNKKEVEVINRDNRWLSVRIQPYRSSSNVIDGVVITFSDVTGLKEAELESREAKITAEAILATTRQPFLVLDQKLHVRAANPAFCEKFQVLENQALGKSIFELKAGLLPLADLKGDFGRLLSNRDEKRVEYDFPDPTGTSPIRMTAYRVDRQDGRPILILLTFDEKGI